MTGAGNPTFIDTNVLVYSTVVQAPLHASARQSLDALRASATELWVSRQILREYLAVLTRPQTFTQPLPIAVLIADVQRFEMEFRVAEDRSDVTAELLRIRD